MSELKFRIRVIETGETEYWSMKQLLGEINRDRSSEWTDYDETDYLEGWHEWIEGEFYELTGILQGSDS